MFTPLVRGTHTGEKKEKKSMSYGCLSSAPYTVHLLQNILGEQRGKGEVYVKQIKGPQWNIARMNVLNKKAFCKNNVFAPFCIMYKNKPPKKQEQNKKRMQKYCECTI